MREDFLHYIWKYSLFSNNPLTLSDGTPIDIISCGEHNHDSGPDFFNAKIKIGNKIWIGNVEIHVLASDWTRHKHHNDKAYDNVILHVVGKNDSQIKLSNGEDIPTTELMAPVGLHEQYLYLMESENWIPCETFIKKIDKFTILQWKETLMIERLQDKSKIIRDRFIHNNKNWEETFYQTLAHNFGFKTNSQPFEMLAKSIPLMCLGKHKDQLPLIEAILFGQAGLIPHQPLDAYTTQLKKDYIHLKNKFKLEPMSGHLWKKSKLRPSNFPAIRIAQFANLIYCSKLLLSKISEAKDFKDIRNLFTLNISKYWETHYTFDKVSVKRTKKFGDNAFQNIVINTITPFFMLIANEKGQPEYSEKAIDWLLQLKAENNSITRHWNGLGVDMKNAFDSQSLIQLKNLYCNNRRCLNCRIGNQVMLHTI